MRYAMLTATHLCSHDDQKYVIDNYADGVVRHILSTVPPGETFKTKQVADSPSLIHLAQSTRQTYTNLVLCNLVACFPHDSGPIIRMSKHYWARVPHPTVHGGRITPAEYEDRIGREPEWWELDMVNCTQSGKLGHYACGWCIFHRQPILWCGCRVRADEN